MTLNVAEIERQIEREMERHRVPGFALAVVQRTEVVYARGFGWTSVEDAALPITPDTLFCSGSISKPLTGATILRLVEQGALDLDVPVVDYLPWLTFSRPDYARAITLRRLLSHTSGLFGTAGNFGPGDLQGLEYFIREAVPVARFVAPPGTVFEYCNVGIDLAGYVAEVAAGKYFPEVVREQVLAPLQMERTTYDRTVAMTYPVALPHWTSPDGTARVQHRMFEYAAANPAGQVMASTLDLARFAIMLLSNGRFGSTEVLSAASVGEMLRPQAHLHDMAGTGYGLTFWTLNLNGLRWVAHAGLLTPYLCELSLVPQRGIGVVFQCNVTNDFDPYRIRRSILEGLLDLPAHPVTPAPRPVTLESPSWSRYTGTYLSLAAGLATIRPGAGHLILDREGRSIPLHPVQEHLFASEDGKISVGFVPGEEELMDYCMLDEHAYRRLQGKPGRELPSAVLDAYAGRYLFDDGDTIAITVRDGQLHASFSWLDGSQECIALDQRTFVCPGGLIEFRDDEGKEPLLAYAGFVFARRIASTTGADHLRPPELAHDES